jgi:hypothetical protein
MSTTWKLGVKLRQKELQNHDAPHRDFFVYNIGMDNITFLIAAIIFGFVFFGPHTKAKEKKDDKKGKK